MVQLLVDLTVTTCVVISLGLLNAAAGEGANYECRTADCDHYSTPSGKDRVCKLYYDAAARGSVALRWYTGTLDEVRCNEVEGANACPGYVGMRMSLWCDFSEGNNTSLYKDGTRTGASIVTFNKLQKENEGVYQCIRSNGSLIGEFNLTVQNDIHIGGVDHFECRRLSRDNENECCCMSWSPLEEDDQRRLNPFTFAVYGDDPNPEPSISLEWHTLPKYHYPTDVGICHEVTDTNVWKVNYHHDPKTVTNDQGEGSRLSMTVQFTFNNSFSSFSFCILIDFPRISNQISANISLPQNESTTVGGVASFFCQFEYPNQNNIICLRFEFLLSDNSSLSTMCNPECEDCVMTTNLSTIISIHSREILGVTSYNISLINVEERLDGSVFSCSISTFSDHREYIEWKGSAYLVVTPAAEVATSNVNGKVIASITVPLNVLVAFVLSVVILLVLIRVKNVKMRHVFRKAEQSIDTVSMTDQLLQNTSSQSTINSDMGSPLTDDTQLPAISIIDNGGTQQDLIVGESLPEIRSMDSGIGYLENDENSQKHPSTKVQLNQNKTTLCLPQRKLVVYISYTDSTSRWVRTTLKPLIDSWNIAEVMIPDRDMVAGKAISDERRRLIVEADKIILVISPDYYGSDWCSYELMHAIQSEPTLSRGRIIPILIDGCQYLPQNMEVVVALLAHELNFSTRLLMALCQDHGDSQCD